MRRIKASDIVARDAIIWLCYLAFLAQHLQHFDWLAVLFAIALAAVSWELLAFAWAAWRKRRTARRGRAA